MNSNLEPNSLWLQKLTRRGGAFLTGGVLGTAIGAALLGYVEPLNFALLTGIAVFIAVVVFLGDK